MTRHYHVPTFEGAAQGLAACLVCGVIFNVDEFLDHPCSGPRHEETPCDSLPSGSPSGSPSPSSSAASSGDSARSAETETEAREKLLQGLCREHNQLGEAMHHANRRRAILARAITRLRMGYPARVIQAELEAQP